MSEYHWDPLTADKLAGVFGPLGVDWWVAGGIAIDLFVGRKTREHGDIDIAVLRRDVGALRQFLPAWDVCIAHRGALLPWHGAALAAEHHQFWVRRPDAQAWSFEVLLENSAGHDWVYRREPNIHRPIDTIGRCSADGAPYLVPEICLLYKSAGASIDRNEADFKSVLPELDNAGRTWLRDALTIVSPEHPWLASL